MTNEVLQKIASDEQNISSSNGLEAKSPLLRFRKFTHPWRQEKLSDFTSRIMRKNSNNETELPLTISSKDGLVDQVTFFNKKVSSKDMSGYYLLKNGEFAYNKSYSNGYDFGSIPRLERYEMGALSTLYICFSLKKHCSDYIKHYFDSLKWYRQIYIISAEGARNHGLLNVPTDDFFATIHFLSPDIEEQKKIADFLSLVDRRIEKQRQLVESLKKYKRGLFFEIFEQKRRFKDGNNKFYPKWEKKSLGTIFKERTERAIGNEELLSVTINSGVKKRCEVDVKDNSSDDKSKYKKLYPNDIAYNTMRMWQGASGVSLYEGIVSPAYTVITTIIPVKIGFFGYYFKYIKTIQIFQKFSQGLTSDTWNLKYPQLSEIQLLIPNIEEQEKIYETFKFLDDKILLSENTLNLLQDIKKGLLQKMFI